MGKLTINSHMFNSYVSLPEATRAYKRTYNRCIALYWGLMGNMDDQPVEIHQKCFSFTMKKMGIQCVKEKPPLSRPQKAMAVFSPLTYIYILYQHGGFSAPKSCRPHWNILKPLLGRKKDPGSDPPRFLLPNFSDRGKHPSVKSMTESTESVKQLQQNPCTFGSTFLFYFCLGSATHNLNRYNWFYRF